MQEGGTQTATAQVFSAGGARMAQGDYSLSWQSSNPAVISVTSQGLVTAEAPGSAMLTASAGNAGGAILITVAAVAAVVASVEIDDADFTIEVGTSRGVSASVADSDRRLMARDVTWSSSNSDVAIVDSGTGEVTGVAAGTVQITASTDGVSGQVTVTVVAAAPALPSAEVARAAIEGFLDALGQGDTDGVTSYWSADDEDGLEELLDMMDQPSFSATLGSVSNAALDGDVAIVSFDIATVYRRAFGGDSNQTLNLRGQLDPVGNAWRLTSLVLQGG